MWTGVDILEIDRMREVLERHGSRFIERVFTDREADLCGRDPVRLAGRFAAKEAVAKALGTGIARAGIGWRDIEILADDAGRPIVRLHGAADVRRRAMGGGAIALSVSHERAFAVAFCVMEREVES